MDDVVDICLITEVKTYVSLIGIYTNDMVFIENIIFFLSLDCLENFRDPVATQGHYASNVKSGNK